MNIIQMGRGQGKTLYCLQRAALTDYPIIVSNLGTKLYLRMKVIDYKLPDVEIYTIDEFLQLGRKQYDAVIIDEVDTILEKMLLTKVDSATITS